MNTEPAKILLRVAIELIVRCSRIRSCIERIEPGETGEHRQLIDTIRSALRENEKVLTNTLKYYSKLSSDEDTEIQNIALEVLDDGLRRFSRSFSTIHELLVYLPRENIWPEMAYMLEKSFGPAYRRQKPSILLGGFFNAVEFDFLDVVRQRLPELSELIPKGASNIVVQLPICDRDSPAAWAILAHELGHAVEASEDISMEVVRGFVTDTTSNVFERLHAWCGELLADLIAAKALGPGPVLALLSLEFCFFPRKLMYYVPSRYKKHPTTRWRLKVVSDFLIQEYPTNDAPDFLREEREFFESAWKFQIQTRREPDVSAREVMSFDDRTYEMIIRPLAEKVVEKMSGLNIPGHRLNSPSIERCLRRLKDQSPISAQGANKEVLRHRIAQYKQARKRFRSNSRRVREFRGLVSDFNELPMSLPGILLSSHKARLKIISEFTGRRSGYGDRRVIGAVCKSLAGIDQRIIDSIRSAGVHENLIHRLKIGRSIPTSGDRVSLMSQYSKTKEVGILSDFEILERLVAEDKHLIFVSPLIDPTVQLGPSSLDLRLGTELLVSKNVSLTHIDLRKGKAVIEKQRNKAFDLWRIRPDGDFVLHPGEFALASTLEYLRLPADIAGRLEGRSSLGRLGLQVHATAGFVDPGFEGALTFELINSGRLPVTLFPGIRLGQICFFRAEDVQIGYMDKKGSKYGRKGGVGSSLIALDPEHRTRK